MITTVHITNAYHGSSGGIRTFYHALLAAAPAAGRRVVLIVPGERTCRHDLGAHGAIYVVRSPRAPAFDRRYRLLLPHHYRPLGSAPIVDVLRAERPALVEIADKYTLPYLAAMLRKRWFAGFARPVLVGLSCERLDDNVRAHLARGAAVGALARQYVRHVYGPPFDVHFAVSAYAAAELSDALWDRRPGFIRVMPMGVDAARFHPSQRRSAVRRTLLERAGGTEDSMLLLYTGRLSPEKNVGLLLDVMARLTRQSPDFRLVIAGDGPESASLQARAAAGSLPVYFHGHVEHDALPRICASVDVFVHPNPREPFGIGPLEAMASGVAVVVPDSGGVLEYASPRNAWLAPASADAFAEAIREAAEAPDARAAQGRRTAAALSWDLTTRRYFAAYDELIGCGSAVPADAADAQAALPLHV